MASSSTWIFGYGSLIHQPGFEHSRAVPGYVRGFRRVCWQGSTDHRGTPAAPGRTVTLTPDEEAVVWGVAYELAGTEDEQRRAIEYLEWREKQYDVRLTVPVYCGRSGTSPGCGPALAVPAVPAALVYLATADPVANVNYLGPASLEAIAQQVAHAAGPSGPNCEYVYRLAHAMRKMGVEDGDLFALEARVRDIRGEPCTAAGAAATRAATSSDHAATSGNSSRSDGGRASAAMTIGAGAAAAMTIGARPAAASSAPAGAPTTRAAGGPPEAAEAPCSTCGAQHSGKAPVDVDASMPYGPVASSPVAQLTARWRP